MLASYDATVKQNEPLHSEATAKAHRFFIPAD